MQKPDLRFFAKLQEQLNFIRRSCSAYDAGAEDEALRIATTLRVIFHDTPKSTSLISHLRLGDSKMYSSSRGHGNYQDYLAYRLDLSSPHPVKALPMLGVKFKELPMPTWWATEPVFLHAGKKFTRKTIILTASNKDGGAHVDDSLDEYYQALRAGEFAFGITGNLTYQGTAPFQQGVTHYATNAHFALIRQFAHETLMWASHRLRKPII